LGKYFAPKFWGEFGAGLFELSVVLLLCKTYSNLITKAEAQVEPQFAPASLRWFPEGEQVVLE